MGKFTDFYWRLYKAIFSAKATPYWALIAVLALGALLTLGIFVAPLFTAIVILTMTLVVVIYIFFIARSVSDDGIRTTDLINATHYDYNTVISEQTWVLEDKEGDHSRVEKKKILKALEPISYVKEYGWGDAKIPAVEDINIIGNHVVSKIYEQGSRYIVEIKLDREYKTGEEITLDYSKNLKGAFTSEKEWVELLITTNVRRTSMIVVFPKERPYKYAKGIYRHGDYVAAIPLDHEFLIQTRMDDGRVALKWTIPDPVQRDLYTIEWTW